MSKTEIQLYQHAEKIGISKRRLESALDRLCEIDALSVKKTKKTASVAIRSRKTVAKALGFEIEIPVVESTKGRKTRALDRRVIRKASKITNYEPLIDSADAAWLLYCDLLLEFHDSSHFKPVISGSNARKFKQSFQSIPDSSRARVICLIVMDWERFCEHLNIKKSPIPTFGAVCGFAECALFLIGSGIPEPESRRKISGESNYAKHVLKTHENDAMEIGF